MKKTILVIGIVALLIGIAVLPNYNAETSLNGRETNENNSEVQKYIAILK